MREDDVLIEHRSFRFGPEEQLVIEALHGQGESYSRAAASQLMRNRFERQPAGCRRARFHEVRASTARPDTSVRNLLPRLPGPPAVPRGRIVHPWEGDGAGSLPGRGVC